MSQTLLINGPVGKLELRVDEPEAVEQSAPVAVICHPHPLHGGTLTNKVVHILASAFNRLGLMAVRFNFRGVGRSDGSFDNAVGEVDDLAAVVAWVRAERPGAPIWLAGFSFGAYVALKGHARLGAERLLLVAPPLSLYSVVDIPPVEIPWLVIQGGEDEVIDAQQVRIWLEQQQQNPPQLVWLEDSGHFFHGRLNQVRDAVVEYWSL
jgi:alpha/beta superfamily hydrolase